MLTLLVDEAYAFDYLAILRVKLSPLAVDTANHIKDQIGVDLFDRIVDSPEFHSMYQANLDVFEAVEHARYGKISAKELDNANMERHYAKQALQKAFFNNELTEKKT